MTRRISNGILCDTKTAEWIARWTNNKSVSDFSYIIETLYKTPDGEYFIFGEGGAMTEYSRAFDNGRVEGDKIQRLNRRDAIRWLEDRDINITDDIITAFEIEKG